MINKKPINSFLATVIRQKITKSTIQLTRITAVTTLNLLWYVAPYKSASRIPAVAAFAAMMMLPVTNLNAIPIDRISINGYLSFEYEKNIAGDKEGDLNGSFDMDLFDLVLNFRATERLRIATDITWEHGAASEDNRGNVAIEYAFAEYSINELYKLRMGKMFTHFGIYNELHTAKPATLSVKEPLATNKNNKLGSNVRFYPRWVTGMALSGTGEINNSEFDYILQLSNGESDNTSINPYEEDINVNKALAARIRISPTDKLRYGFSFYKETTGDNDNGTSYGIQSLGAQFEWELHNSLAFELEIVSGYENVVGGANIDRYAYTMMLSYAANKLLTPYLRLEYLDPDKNTPKNNAALNVFGVNMLVDSNMYIKLEVNHISTNINNAEYIGADFSEFKASLAVGF